MKWRYILYASLFTVVGFSILNSCTEDFEEINSDPLLITRDQVNPDAILTYVLNPSVFSFAVFGRIGEYAGLVSNLASGYPRHTIFGSLVWYRDGSCRV